jgi:hypothetical protein
MHCCIEQFDVRYDAVWWDEDNLNLTLTSFSVQEYLGASVVWPRNYLSCENVRCEEFKPFTHRKKTLRTKIVICRIIFCVISEQKNWNGMNDFCLVCLLNDCVPLRRKNFHRKIFSSHPHSCSVFSRRKKVFDEVHTDPSKSPTAFFFQVKQQKTISLATWSCPEEQQRWLTIPLECIRMFILYTLMVKRISCCDDFHTIAIFHLYCFLHSYQIHFIVLLSSQN